ncbi:hypothetical protein BBP40_006128 [Aspergillus hancockii]|nr:hypothetical protein BBP40_006128 [Aspergillus hancockii]
MDKDCSSAFAGVFNDPSPLTFASSPHIYAPSASIDRRVLLSGSEAPTTGHPGETDVMYHVQPVPAEELQSRVRHTPQPPQQQQRGSLPVFMPGDTPEYRRALSAALESLGMPSSQKPVQALPMPDVHGDKSQEVDEAISGNARSAAFTCKRTISEDLVEEE